MGVGGWDRLQGSSCSDADPQLPETVSLPRILTGAQLTTGNCCFPTITFLLLGICGRPQIGPADHLGRGGSAHKPPVGQVLRARGLDATLALIRTVQFGFAAPPRFTFPAPPLLALASRTTGCLIGRRSGKCGARICSGGGARGRLGLGN